MDRSGGEPPATAPLLAGTQTLETICPRASSASSAGMAETWTLPGEFGLYELLAAGVFQEVRIDFIGHAGP